MTYTLSLGFVLIGGLLVGYLSARLAPKWAVWTALICVAAIFPVVFISYRIAGPEYGMAGAIILNAVVLPFIGSVFISAVIGALARRIADRDVAS